MKLQILLDKLISSLSEIRIKLNDSQKMPSLQVERMKKLRNYLAFQGIVTMPHDYKSENPILLVMEDDREDFFEILDEAPRELYEELLDLKIEFIDDVIESSQTPFLKNIKELCLDFWTGRNYPQV